MNTIHQKGYPENEKTCDKITCDIIKEHVD